VTYTLAETTGDAPLPEEEPVAAQIHAWPSAGIQIPILTSRTDLRRECAGVCPRAGGRRTTSNTPANTSPSTDWTATGHR